MLEYTGHYHRLLEQYLLELDITVYRIHVQERPKGMMKTDKRDALNLANRLYTQLECAIRSLQTEQSGDGRQRTIFDNYLFDVG